MKGLITVCSECGAKTELREITIEFERKGIQATMSGIPAMVCPNCGEQYIPGDISGDMIDIVSSAIDQLESLLRRAGPVVESCCPRLPSHPRSASSWCWLSAKSSGRNGERETR